MTYWCILCSAFWFCQLFLISINNTLIVIWSFYSKVLQSPLIGLLLLRFGFLNSHTCWAEVLEWASKGIQILKCFLWILMFLSPIIVVFRSIQSWNELCNAYLVMLCTYLQFFNIPQSLEIKVELILKDTKAPLCPENYELQSLATHLTIFHRSSANCWLPFFALPITHVSVS